jgi:transcription elongation factor Elf1
MATAKKKTGFAGLICPICGEDDGPIRLDLADLGECYCENCGDSFPVSRAIEELTKSLEAWKQVEKMVAVGRELANE